MKKYFKIWKQLAILSISSYFSNRIESFTYLIGKLIRFFFFFLLIVNIFERTDAIAGYDKYEALLFFLTFSFIDVFSQAFLRGIYYFKEDVNRGNFDFVISKPVNPLFFALTRLTDLLDLGFLVIIIALLILNFHAGSIVVSAAFFLLYVIFIILGLLIVLGIHIITAAFTIEKIESENLIWLYRDAITVGRFPPDIFSPTVQALFTFIVPTIVIIAFPVKALLGILSWQWMVFAIIYAIGFFVMSLLIWKKSLKKYSSASS